MKQVEEQGFKLLVICSTLNLDYPYGATPMIWQLLKGLYEVGCDNIVIPYRGRALRSLWWRCYPNPARLEGELFARMKPSEKVFRTSTSLTRAQNQLVPKAAHLAVVPKWRQLLRKIYSTERSIDAVLIVGVPINQITGIARFIKELFQCPVVYYELDVPTSLPKFGGFSFNYFEDADLDEYDVIVSPSEGAADDLYRFGAKRVEFVHFGVDPDLFLPIEIGQDIDIFFYGTSDTNREGSIRLMISDPSEALDANFLVSGLQFKVNLGKATRISMIPFSQWRNYACRSKVNLNIPRENHASTYATSTSRPFELAAMGCCIVSAPYNGLEKWFDINREMLVAENTEEAVELYRWLLEDENARKRFGLRARQRVVKEHTFRHRAKRILRILKA